MSTKILIIDDEDDIRKLIKGILEDEGFSTRQANGSAKAYEEIETQVPDLVILDIWLQGSEHDGLEILRNIKKKFPFMPVIMISGHGTIETAVSAIKMGAYDFIEKPFKSDRLLLMIERALEISALKKENEVLREKHETPVSMIGNSAPINTIIHSLEKLAVANSRVLFTGEAGVGKGMAARALHAMSPRKSKPFLSLNCAILHPDTIEQELFGIEDTNGVRPGILEQANGGSILLDEVGDMPLETQGKIVRILQEQKFSRVNGRDVIHVDVRILTASSRNLEKSIKSGDFREDLYYRLNVVTIDLPPLKERKEDISQLAEYFMEAYSKQSGQPARPFSSSAIIALQGYDWPGNIRQLKNIVEWVMIMGAGEKNPIDKNDLPPEVSGLSTTSKTRDVSIHDYMTFPLREAREAFERDYLDRQLSRFNGNISKTAAYVGMERSALHRKLKSLDVNNHDKDNSPTDDVDMSEFKQAV